MTHRTAHRSPARSTAKLGSARQTVACLALWAVVVAGLAIPASAQPQQPPAPAPASGLAAPDASCVSGPGSISVSWSSVPGATGYQTTVQDFYSGQVVAESSRITETSHTFTGLAPQPLGYMVWVSAHDTDRERSSLLKCAVTEAAGAGGASGASCPPGQVCGTTSHVRCKENDHADYKDKLKIEWDAVQGTTGYTVERWLVPILSTDVSEKLQTVTTTATSYEFTGLVRSRAYNFKVYANAGGLTAMHGEVSCRTYVLPAPTRSGIACATTHNSITYSWNPVTDAESYGGKIQLDKAGSKQTDIPTPTATADGTRITSTITLNQGARLLTATPYFIGVLAFLNDIPQHWTGIACWTSPADPTCSDITPTQIKLSWNPGSTAQDFYVYLGDEDNQEKTAHVYRDAFHTFTGLTPDTYYTLNVEAGPPPTYTDPWIKRSSPASIRCKTEPPPPPPQPKDLACVDGSATTSSFSVSWTVSPGATKYQGRVNSDNWMPTDSSTGHAFAGLSPGGSYSVEVQAGNSGGWSKSSTRTCHTIPPIPVVSCANELATTTSFSASWAAVTGASKYRANRDGGDWSDTTATSHAFAGLSPGGSYEVDVQAGNTAGWSDSGEKTCHTKPDMPVVVCVAGSASRSGFTASWAAVDGADKYRANIDGGDWSETTATSHPFSDLEAGRSYSVEVQAGNDAGWGDGGMASCETLPPLPPPPPPLVAPPPPSGFDCVEGSSTTSGFGVSWTTAARATTYQVQIDSGGWSTAGSTTGHSFSNLSAGGEFTVEVRAGNSGGWSPASSATCYTLTVAPVVSCSAATTSGFTASWAAVDGADGYQVRIGDDDEDWEAETGTSRAFADLGAGGEFAVDVQAQNGGLWSSTGEKTCFTLPNAPVVACVAGSATVSGFSVSWAEATGATKYQIRLDGGRWQTPDSTVGHAFSDLSAGGEFAVEVQAGNGGGWSASGAASCSTLPDAPVVSCVEGSATVSGFSVSWAEVTGATKYQIRLDGGRWQTPDSTVGHAFSDLSAGGTHSVEVQAGNDAGWGASGTSSCSTLPDAPVVSCVAGSATASGFSVSWAEVTGAAKYQVRLDGGRWQTPDSTTGHAFSNLAAASEYSVEVRAGNDAGRGAAGSRACSTTPKAPTGLECSNERATTFAASWEEAEGATSYRAGLAGGYWQNPDSSVGHGFSGLSPNVEYSVLVQAGNDAGWSASASVSCLTVPGGAECGVVTATTLEIVTHPEPAAEVTHVWTHPVRPPGAVVGWPLGFQMHKQLPQSLVINPLATAAVHRVKLRWTNKPTGSTVYETDMVCAVAGTRPQVTCSTLGDVTATWAAVPGSGVAYRATVELIGEPTAGPPGRSPDPDGTTAVAAYAGAASHFTADSPWFGTHRVTVEARADAGRWWPLGAADTACPDPAAQYLELYLLSGAALQNINGALDGAPAQYSLAEFISQRARFGTAWPFGHPWMNWNNNGCPGGTDTLTLFGHTVSFRDACDRHDFTIRNLHRIEHRVDPNLNTWNSHNELAADTQLLEDLLLTCDNAYHDSPWNRPDCHQAARTIYENTN